jgi:polyketide cyclase/dehydrase/lipid transport protein
MPEFANTEIINASPDLVFGFLADFENVPIWNYAIEATTQVSPGPVGVGTVYRQIRSLPTRSEEGFEVTKFEPVHQLAIDGPIGPYQMRASYRLEPTGHATKLTNNVHLEPLPGPLNRLALLGIPKVRSAMAKNLAQLKQVLEGS